MGRDNALMALAPWLPLSVDPTLVESATSGLAGTGSLTFLVDDDAVTYTVDGSTVRVQDGQDDGDTVVRLSRKAWDDMVGQARTFVNLFLGDELAFDRGGFERLADWDPMLKYLHAGIPPCHPARVDFHGRDPSAAFTLAADGAELAAQLQTMGYLQVDVTVHIGDVMHASPQPTGAGGRRTMYVTHYPAKLWQHVGPIWCATAPNRSRACSSRGRLGVEKSLRPADR